MNHSMPGRIALLTIALALALAAAKAQTLTCIVADGQYVNVRNRPSTSAASWGILHNGDTIEADPMEITGGFFKTTFREREAYVSVRYFEIAEEAAYTVSANGRVRVSKMASATGRERVHLCA